MAVQEEQWKWNAGKVGKMDWIEREREGGRERERWVKIFLLLCRRNWKNRYFALRGKTLFYYSESDLATAKPNGAIDLKDVT